MSANKIPNKHLKTLERRLNYLESLVEKGEGNSYDKAEIAALIHILDYIEQEEGV